MGKLKEDETGFTVVELFLLLAIVVLLGGMGWLVYKDQHKTTTAFVSASTSTQKKTNTTQAFPTISSTATGTITSNWETFRASTEGFTLKYPPDWIVTNISGSTGGPVYDLTAPDGLIVRYVYEGQGTTDSTSCGPGTGAGCVAQTVLSINSLAVPNYRTVDFITTTPLGGNGGGNCYSASLDLPSGSSTTPVVGNNSFSNHEIDFSLPSKNGGRYDIFITNSVAGTTTFQCSNMTQTQFFNTVSVQQAEDILRSISYSNN